MRGIVPACRMATTAAPALALAGGTERVFGIGRLSFRSDGSWPGVGFELGAAVKDVFEHFIVVVVIGGLFIVVASLEGGMAGVIELVRRWLGRLSQWGLSEGLGG